MPLYSKGTSASAFLGLLPIPTGAGKSAPLVALLRGLRRRRRLHLTLQLAGNFQGKVAPAGGTPLSPAPSSSSTSPAAGGFI